MTKLTKAFLRRDATGAASRARLSCCWIRNPATGALCATWIAEAPSREPANTNIELARLADRGRLNKGP